MHQVYISNLALILPSSSSNCLYVAFFQTQFPEIVVEHSDDEESEEDEDTRIEVKDATGKPSPETEACLAKPDGEQDVD